MNDLVTRARFWASDGHPHGLLHGECADEIEKLRAALNQARGAIWSLPEDALGWHEPQHEEDVIWPLRDELLHMIDTALNNTQDKPE